MPPTFSPKLHESADSDRAERVAISTELLEHSRNYWLAMWMATQGLREEIKADPDSIINPLAPLMFASGSLFLSSIMEMGGDPLPLLDLIARTLGIAPPTSEALH